jgi:hypothetical protein
MTISQYIVVLVSRSEYIVFAGSFVLRSFYGRFDVVKGLYIIQCKLLSLTVFVAHTFNSLCSPNVRPPALFQNPGLPENIKRPKTPTKRR